MDSLPDEIILNIASFLTGNLIYSFSCVSWRLYHLLNDGVNIRYLHCLKDETRNELFFSISDGKDQDIKMDYKGGNERWGRASMAMFEKAKKLNLPNDFWHELPPENLFTAVEGKYYTDWRWLIPYPISRYQRKIWESGIDMKTRFVNSLAFFDSSQDYTYYLRRPTNLLINFEVVTPLYQLSVYYPKGQLICHRKHLKKGDVVWPFVGYGYLIVFDIPLILVMIPETDRHLTPLVYGHYIFLDSGLYAKLHENKRYTIGMNGKEIIQQWW